MGDLARACGKWVAALKQQDDSLAIDKKIRSAAFDLVDKRRRKNEKAGKGKWDLSLTQSKSWAIKMGNKLGLLLRHYSQAVCKDEKTPKWAQQIQVLVDEAWAAEEADDKSAKDDGDDDGHQDDDDDAEQDQEE